jgi:hypothetical protein
MNLTSFKSSPVLLWTHDPSIGNTWQRSHVHFVDTWHFYWKHVVVLSKCTWDLCDMFPIEVSRVHKVYMGPLPRVSNRNVIYPQSVHGTPCTLCGNMTLLLETRGNGSMYTLWTHDNSIGNKWQRSHVHFVDTWPFYWKHVATVPCTLCGHMTFLFCLSQRWPLNTGVTV